MRSIPSTRWELIANSLKEGLRYSNKQSCLGNFKYSRQSRALHVDSDLGTPAHHVLCQKLTRSQDFVLEPTRYDYEVIWNDRTIRMIRQYLLNDRLVEYYLSEPYKPELGSHLGCVLRNAHISEGTPFSIPHVPHPSRKLVGLRGELFCVGQTQNMRLDPGLFHSTWSMVAVSNVEQSTRPGHSIEPLILEAFA